MMPKNSRTFGGPSTSGKARPYHREWEAKSGRLYDTRTWSTTRMMSFDVFLARC
jgi:hypothetical protein